MKYFQRSLPEREPRQNQIVTSFYYSYREGERQTNHSNMLRSVLYDILNQNEEFFFHFQSFYREVVQGGRYPEWSYTSLKELLLSLAINHPESERLYLIVDAMDESDDGERRDVIDFLLALCATRGHCLVKVFVASRPVVGLGGHSAANHKLIRLQDVNESDISKFAESFLGDPKLDLPSRGVTWAKEYITENAQGVFVWVHLVKAELLEYASEGCREEEITDFLESVPKELEGVYGRMLERLEGGKKRNVEDGKKMLQFVLFAYRPLGLGELGQALAIRDKLGHDAGYSLSDESLQRGLIHGMEKRIISCAANFLEIKAGGGHSSYLSHPTL